MQILKLDALKEFSPAGFNKKELVVTDSFKLLLICFGPGQAVDPCVMSRHTMFFIIEGEGKVIEAGQEAAVSAGSIVLIEPELERQILAETRMVVLATQYS